VEVLRDYGPAIEDSDRAIGAVADADALCAVWVEGNRHTCAGSLRT